MLSALETCHLPNTVECMLEAVDEYLQGSTFFIFSKFVVVL